MYSLIEQSGLNAPLRYTKEVIENGKGKLISKHLVIDNIFFGPPEKITIHQKNGVKNKYLIKRENDSQYYLYYENKLSLKTELTDEQVKEDRINDYLYGVAKYQGELIPYLIQNNPKIRIKQKPSYEEFTLPTIFTGFPYDNSFSYNQQLIELIGELPATYTDKYKRPINSNALENNLYYPISIEKVTTTFNQLANTYDYHMPLVVNLKDTEFACVDLEPNYTKDDLILAESFDAYYEEETPNGGKHYLVKIEASSVFKYRLSDKIEVQANCQITLYGINGIFHGNDISYSDFSKYKIIGHSSHDIEVKNKPPEIDDIVKALHETNHNLSEITLLQMKRDYLLDDDVSHADFMFVKIIYHKVIEPIQNAYDHNILPWILAEYAVTFLPPRVKHASDRCGVPYLVYIADKIINNQISKAKIYD